MGIFDRFKKKSTEEKIKEKEAKKGQQDKVKVDKKDEYSTLKAKGEDTAPVEPVTVKDKPGKVKKTKKEDTKDAYKVFIKPLVTEKATELAALNKYCFEVANNVNKIEIKKAIQALYGVEPIDVNIINMKGKRVRYGRIEGKKKNWKKAIISLKEGEKIELYEGV